MNTIKMVFSIVYFKKGICLIALLSIWFHFGQAQKIPVITSNEIVAGRDHLNNKDIYAIEYLFPEKIHDFYFNADNQSFTLHLRGSSDSGFYVRNNGKYCLFNLAEKKVKWINRNNYRLNSLQQFDTIILKTNPETTTRINLKTGHDQWVMDKNILFVDPRAQVCLGYPYGFYDRLEAYDMNSGNLLWFRGISRECGWNYVMHLNDSVIIVVADGLHMVNLKTGYGWDYKAVTGTKDYSSTVMLNAFGILSGIITGVYYTYYGYGVNSDLVSNVIANSTYLYFASREKIACLNYDGNEIWNSPFPKRKGSKSSIFIKDSLIYVVNYGCAYSGYQRIDFGTPFIAAYNKYSGKQIYFSERKDEMESIVDFLSGENTIVLLLEDHLVIYSLESGTLIYEKEIPLKKNGELFGFVANEFDIESDSVYLSLGQNDPSKLYVLTFKDKILKINADFEIDSIIDAGKLFFRYLYTDKYRFVFRNKETLIINNENKRIAVLQASRNAILSGDKLYDRRGKSLLEIDLSGIIHLEN